jgi:formiminoglutamase
MPDELADRVALSASDVMDDIDLFTPELYDLTATVLHTRVADMARPFVDLNRAPDQLPPQFPDGVIKSHTCFNIPVFRPGLAPDTALVRHLLETYHTPYHPHIERLMRAPGVELMLDCHSMSEFPPPIAPDQTERRPLINLGDLGGKACPRAITERLARCMAAAFSIEAAEVTINRPFQGGYITQRHGASPRPVIQLEINRALYFDPENHHRRDAARIERVRNSLEAALHDFCSKPLA